LLKRALAELLVCRMWEFTGSV